MVGMVGLAKRFFIMPILLPILGVSRSLSSVQPPFHRSWFSHSSGYPMPGFVSTLLNHTYSTPLREVHTFLQVTEQVWHPIHLSRFITMAICARICIVFEIFKIRRWVHPSIPLCRVYGQ